MAGYDAMYYKATRLDGTDFRTGTINYGAALVSGKTLHHPNSQLIVENAPSTYLSISVTPTGTMLGGKFPCRLFEVEPVGDMLKAPYSIDKRTVLAMRVVRELPAHLVFGPQGREIEALIEQLRTITPDRFDRLIAAWNAAREAVWGAVWSAAREAVWSAAWEAAGEAAWEAVREAAREAVREAAWEAAWGAVLALLVKDRISQSHFDTLYGPWKSAIELD